MDESAISLGEGNTPLLRSRRIGPEAGLSNLYFKLESVNPTGSYKDRFAVAAIRDMVRQGQSRVIASSSGNAGAALAAYCAAAGMTCQIAVVEGATDGKLKQMLAYGAKLWKIHGFGRLQDVTTEVMNYLSELGDRGTARLQISAYRHSPIGMAGVESISHELARQAATLDRPVDHVFVPVGGGGLLLAVAKGFDAVSVTTGKKGPKVHCVQPAGNDTLGTALREGREGPQPISQSTTRVTGLQIPNLIDAEMAFQACRKSRGTGFLVEDTDVEWLQARLAREEGIFCEPAAAVGLAGALQAVQAGLVLPDEMVVCLITGSGFKDPAAVDRMLSNQGCPTVSLDEFRQRTA